MKKLLVVGSVNTDLVVRAAQLPSPGHTVMGRDFRSYGGGKGANQAVAAARAGAAVTFAGCVGDDAFGTERRAELAAEGIDVSALTTIKDVATGVGLIVIDDAAENQIAVAPGANAHMTPSMLDHLDFIQFGVVLLQLEIPLETVEAALRKGRAAGCLTILNPAPAISEARAFLSHVDVLLPNEHEAALLAGEPSAGTVHDPELVKLQVRHLIGQGAGKVVVTRGRRGALIAEPGNGDSVRIVEMDAVPVEPLDTVGAGDCFAGWVAAKLAEGCTLQDAVNHARHAAALSVTRNGAMASMPTRAEVAAMMERVAPAR
ncbi:ribokinase [candidate division BRC1 bacterium HGW-BRC1-1]|jgi:ribokinase|nr:MAG: ribokinase [candidate division BRC1 bacterium HGW-BRC1-1]